MITINELYTYPVKSTKGIHREKVEVSTTGLYNDRMVAIIDSNNRIVTGREHPKLLLLSTELTDTVIVIDAQIHMVTFRLPQEGFQLELKLFRNKIMGLPFNTEANDWISEYLAGAYRLVYLGKNNRPIPEKRGGNPEDRTGFTDSSPIHLVNLDSLKQLNLKLKQNVTVRNFRPNIVVSGATAFEEDGWKYIKINGMDFRVQERTQRCIFTTIHPLTAQVNTEMQPLATIARMRLKQAKKPTFGINLIPMGKGVISQNDILTIIS